MRTRNGDGCGVDPHSRRLNIYLKFIFPFLRSGVQAKRSVEFCHSTRNASRIGQKVGNGESLGSLCLPFCVRVKKPKKNRSQINIYIRTKSQPRLVGAVRVQDAAHRLVNHPVGADEVRPGDKRCYNVMKAYNQIPVNEEDIKKTAISTSMKEYDIVINIPKCVFDVKEVTFLEYHISASGTIPLESKVQAIKDFPTLETAK